MSRFNQEMIRFIMVGLINTLSYYLLYLLGHFYLDWHYLIAHFVSFFISLVGSFFLNTYFTYRVKPTWTKFITFPLSQVANTVITTVTLYVLVELFSLPSVYAPIVAMIFTVPITFVITRKILT